MNSMSKLSSTCRDLKKIKKIRAKSYKNNESSRISTSRSDYYYSLSSDSYLYERIQPY